MEFNPDLVKEYRLIGFDNKVGALRDSLSVIEGGEIGSGHSMIALFEIVPTEASQKAVATGNTTGKFAEIVLRYQNINEEKQCRNSFVADVHFTPFETLEESHRFSAALAMFGSLLRNSPFIKNNSWNEVLALATAASGTGDLLQQEFIALVQQTKTLYSKVRKKKGGNSQN